MNISAELLRDAFERYRLLVHTFSAFLLPEVILIFELPPFHP